MEQSRVGYMIYHYISNILLNHPKLLCGYWCILRLIPAEHVALKFGAYFTKNTNKGAKG